MSTEVVWNVIKNHSAFMKKQKQGCKITMFSTDNMNVLNAYTYGSEGKHIMLSIKSTKHTTKPCKMAKKAHVKRAASVAKEVWSLSDFDF